jgi:cystathionine gamma-lyase
VLDRGLVAIVADSNGFHGLITRFDLLNHPAEDSQVSHDTDKPSRFGTRVIHAGQSPDPSTGAIMPPIYATSTFVQQSPACTRAGLRPLAQPDALGLRALRRRPRRRLAGVRIRVGLAAISTVLELLDAGSHIVSGDDVYGGTFRLFERVRAKSAGHRFSFVDLTDRQARRRASRRRPSWCGSRRRPIRCCAWPTCAPSPTSAASAASCARPTTRSPAPGCSGPLELGFDIVVHSTTKYLNGHSDVIGGVAVVGTGAHHDAIRERLGFLQNAVGAIAGPFDSFLALRGLKTLALRMERHCSNAMALAHWLAQQPKVARVHYPGLESHPQHALAKRQMRGYGG